MSVEHTCTFTATTSDGTPLAPCLACLAGQPGYTPHAETLPLTADDVRRIVREELANVQVTVNNATFDRESFADGVLKALTNLRARGMRAA